MAEAKPLSPEALDFAPGLLAIQESPPARLPRAVMYTVGTLFVILLLWAMFGKLNVIASAEGRLVPENYVKIVQPADAGIVKEILVKEGEQVQAGQVLMRMDAKIAEADAKTINNDLGMRSLQLRRIDAELAGKPLVRKLDDPPDIFRHVEAQYRDHRQAYLASLGQARDALNKAQREHDSAVEVLVKLRETVPLLKKQADAYTDMGKDGYVPKVQVLEKQRDYLERSQDLRAQEATVASLEAAVSQSRNQLDEVTSKYRSDLMNERMEAEGQHNKLQQDWVKQEYKNGLLELRAPHAGVVKDIATHTAGTVVSPGTVLLSIVPDNEPLVAEVMVKNDDVGFVYQHQKVKVKLAPYPFEEYGMLDGEVSRIDADSDPQSQQSSNSSGQSRSGQQTQPSVYKAIITLDQQMLEAEGKQFKLAPGMQVVAEINQGSRTVMQFLLSPVTKTLDESGHER
jgi:membrane fusion protein, hemolysin D